MKKFALLLTLLLALVPLMASCGDKEVETETETETEFVPEEIEFTDIMKTEFVGEDIFNLGEAQLLEELENCSCLSSSNDLVEFVNYSADSGEIKYGVYNTKLEKLVYTLTQEAEDAKTVTTASIVSCDNVSFIQELKKTTSDETDDATRAYVLYTDDGVEFLTKEDTGFVLRSQNNNLISIDSTVYSAKDGALTKLFALGMKKIPQCNILTDEYNYYTDSYYDKCAYVYDQKFDLVTYVEGDSNADTVNFNVLNNGNILVTNIYQLIDEAEEYMYACGISKFNYENFIFDVKTGERTYVELDFMIQGVINSYSFSNSAEINYNDIFIADSFENLAVITPVVDKTVEFSQFAYELVELDNDLKVIGTLKDAIPNQTTNLPQLIADNRFIVSNVSGQTFLLDESGKILGDVTGDVSNNYGEYGDVFAYLFADRVGNVYDMDLNVVFNYKLDAYTQPSWISRLYTKDNGKYAILTSGGFVDLDITTAEADEYDYDTVGDAIGFYVTKEVDDETVSSYVLYNEAGQCILDVTIGYVGDTYVNIASIQEIDDNILVYVSVYDEETGKTTYKNYVCSDNVPA